MVVFNRVEMHHLRIISSFLWADMRSSHDTSTEIKCDCLDILSDVLHHFGNIRPFLALVCC
jgi:hypothetical protein